MNKNDSNQEIQSNKLCYSDILNTQERMTQVAERLSSLVTIVTKLVESSQAGAESQRDSFKLSEEIKEQLANELTGIASDMQHVRQSLDNLENDDKEIQELRDIVRFKLTEGIEKLIKLNYQIKEPVRKESQVPYIAAIHEILKLSRRVNNCDEETGDKLGGFRFFETKLVYALWSAIGAAVATAIIAALKKFGGH